MHAAGGDFAYRGHQLIACALFVEVAGSPRAYGTHRVLVFAVHAQHQHRQFGAGLFDQFDEFNAAAAGHRHVGDEHVPCLRPHHRQHIVTIGGLAGDDDIALLGENLLQALAHDGVVVGDQHADHAAHDATPGIVVPKAGIIASISVPPLGAPLMVMSPPST